MQDLAPVLVVSALLVFVGYLVWLVSNWWLRARHVGMTMEFHRRLLDRLGSPEEFARFMETEGGRKLVESLSEPPPQPAGQGTLRAVQAGIVSLSLCLALFGLDWIYPEDEGFQVLAVITLALGLGLILSAWVSHRFGERLADS